MADVKIKILICDDDKTDIILFKKLFTSEKKKFVEIVEASSTKEIENILSEKNNGIDVIFLDYQMPVKSGIEWLREIKHQNIAPVIMLTGQGDEKVAVEAMKEGAVDYIPKDQLMNSDILKTITQAIDRWQIENERDQLLGIAAHELRSPLTVIIGYTDIIKSFTELDEQKKSELNDIINERAKHLLDIINQILDITRIEKGIIELEKIDCNISKILENRVADYSLRAENKNIEIKYQTELPEVMVMIDPNRIDEVLSNLIDNAIKYSNPGTVVNVSLEKQKNNAIIKIADQ
jgi:two-component system, sensor histidine kinase and response regulator